MRKVLLVAAAVLASVGMLVGGATGASAFFDDDPTNDPTPNTGGPAAEVKIVGTQYGGYVRGVLGAIPATPPPAYPAQPAGTPYDQYAALIIIQDTTRAVGDPLATRAKAFCVNLRTTTGLGVQYSAAEWGDNVANDEYIRYILVNNPPPDLDLGGAALATAQQRVATIQSAIWYFSDGFVLTDANPLRPAVAALVDAAIQNAGPPTPPPTLAVAPAQTEVPSDAPAAGPFQVSGNAVGATVQQITRLRLYSDAGRTNEVVAGDAVPLGGQLWAGSVLGGTPSAGFTVGGDYAVEEGTLYLADPGPDTYQKIVLAQDSILPVRADAAVSVYAANAVTLTKRIGGERAGRQGEVVFEIRCTPAPAAQVVTRVTIPASSPAGDYVRTVTGLRSGSTCSIVETSDGANTAAVLSGSSVTPASFTVPAAGQPAVTATAVDTYIRPQPVLPNTGAPDLAGAALLGAGLVAAGVLSIVLRRRRTT